MANIFQGLGIPLLYSNMVGKPFAVVTENGPTDGGDFGGNTPGTTTGGVQEALNTLPSTGGIVLVRSGNYTYRNTIFGVANNVTLIFEPGCQFTFTNPNNKTFVAFLNMVNNSAMTEFYSYIYVYGNYTYVDLGGYSGSPISAEYSGDGIVTGNRTGYNGTLSSASGYITNCVFDGFIFEGGGGWAMANIGVPSSVTTLGMEFIKFSHIYGYNNAGSPQGSDHALSPGIMMYAVEGGSESDTIYNRNITFEYCYIVMQNNSSSYDYSSPYITDGARYITFRSCYFQTISGIGQLELQGTQDSASGVIHYTLYITFEDCIFNGGSGGGSGGFYIDDNNNSGIAGYIANIAFIRCNFLSTGVTTQSYASYFGYIRFVDCTSAPTGVSLTGRGAGQSVSISVGASTFTYTNADGFPELVSVSGGTVTSITQDGMATGLTAGVFYVPAGHNIAVAYSSAPTMAKVAL